MTDGNNLDISSILIAAFVQQCSEPFNCGMHPIEDPSGQINTVFCEDGFAYLSPEPPDKLILPKFDRKIPIKCASSQNRTSKKNSNKKQNLKKEKVESNNEDEIIKVDEDINENLKEKDENQEEEIYIEENFEQEVETKKAENLNQESEVNEVDNLGGILSQVTEKIVNQIVDNNEEEDMNQISETKENQNLDQTTEVKDKNLNQETENKEEDLDQTANNNEEERLNQATENNEGDNLNQLAENKEENSNQTTENKEEEDLNKVIDNKEENSNQATENKEEEDSNQVINNKEENSNQTIENKEEEDINQKTENKKEEDIDQTAEIKDKINLSQEIKDIGQNLLYQNDEKTEDADLNQTNEKSNEDDNETIEFALEDETENNGELEEIEDDIEEDQNNDTEEDEDVKKLRALTDEIKSLTEKVADITINEFNIEWGLKKGSHPYLISCEGSTFIFSDDLMPFSMYFNQILLFIGYESALTVTPGQCITPNKKCIGSQLSVNRQKFEVVQIQKYFQSIINNNTSPSKNYDDFDDMDVNDIYSCTPENATLLSNDAADKLIQYIIKRLCALFPQMMMSNVPCCSHCFRIYSRISLSSPIKSTKEAKKPRGLPKTKRNNYYNQVDVISFDKQSGHTASRSTHSTRAVERGKQTLMMTSPSRNQRMSRTSQNQKSANKKPSIIPATMFEPFQKTQSGLTIVQNISTKTYQKSYKIYSSNPFPAFIQHT